MVTLLNRWRGNVYRTNVIKAIHDSDLKRVLCKLQLYEKLTGGELKCAICSQPLNSDNLGGLYRDRNGEIKLVCNRMECLVKATEEVKANRSR